MEIIHFIPFISFVLFIALLGGKIVVLKQKGNVLSVKKKGFKETLNTLFLIFFFALYTSALLLRQNWPEVLFFPFLFNAALYSNLLLDSFGVLLIALSVLMMYFTLHAFKDALRFGLNPGNTGPFVSSGIFLLTRNPFFISVECLLTGIALVLPSPYFIGTAALSVLTIHIHIRKEEKFLEEQYGQEYRDYCKKVGRYF